MTHERRRGRESAWRRRWSKRSVAHRSMHQRAARDEARHLAAAPQPREHKHGVGAVAAAAACEHAHDQFLEEHVGGEDAEDAQPRGGRAARGGEGDGEQDGAREEDGRLDVHELAEQRALQAEERPR